MYCRNCGNEVVDKAVMCVSCGENPKAGIRFCQSCGQDTVSSQDICSNCGVMLTCANSDKDKLVAGLLAIFLGGFAAHKFYLGYTREAVITLLIMWGGLILIGIPTMIMSVIVFVEGIIYLSKSDEEFIITYVRNKKGWF